MVALRLDSEREQPPQKNLSFSRAPQTKNPGYATVWKQKKNSLISYFEISWHIFCEFDASIDIFRQI